MTKRPHTAKELHELTDRMRKFALEIDEVGVKMTLQGIDEIDAQLGNVYLYLDRVELALPRLHQTFLRASQLKLREDRKKDRGKE